MQSGGHRPRRGCGSRRVLMQLIQVTEPMPQAVPAGTSWAPDSVPLSLSLSLCPSPFSFLLNKTTHIPMAATVSPNKYSVFQALMFLLLPTDGGCCFP